MRPVPAPDLTAVRRVLVLLLCPIGDTLFATPVLRALRRAMPAAHIIAVAYPTNGSLLEGRPDVDEIILHPSRATVSWRAVRDGVAALRVQPFDLAVSLNPVLTPLYRLLARAAQWVELPLPPWWWLRSARRTPWAQTHAVEIYLRTLAPLGIRPVGRSPDLPVTAAHRAAIGPLLAAQNIPPGTPLFALHPGGEGYGGMKRWPPERFATVGNALIQQQGGAVVVIGGRGDQPLADRLLAELRVPAADLCGATGLLETAALLERCRLLVGNDSSPLHLAAASGTPVVGVFGPSNPAQFAPLALHGEVVRSGRHCSPCFHFTGTQTFWEHPFCSRARCLEEVTPDMVLTAAARLLAGSPPRRQQAA